MKNTILIIILLSFLGCKNSLFKPLDIRNDFLKKEITQADREKGKALLLEMENAYGGKENWLAHQQATFIQKADWYGRKKISGWDTLPQRFQMTSHFGSMNSDLTFLNGKNKGVKWSLENDNFYTQKINQEKVFKKNNKSKDKLIYKTYWFQFPFRISEAPIIAYAGQGEVNGKMFELVYATWGKETANKEYDQFILYLDPKTKLIAYSHFTVREQFDGLSLTSRFDDFRKIENLTFSFSQYVTKGSPQKNGMKFHENHYEKIQLGKMDR